MPENMHPSNAEIFQLLEVPDNKRTLEWESRFLQILPNSNLSLLSPDPQAGPDGWPYLFASTRGNSMEPAEKIISWLSERGIGLVINPDLEIPDYVFTYGDLWSYRHHGSFRQPKEGQPEVIPIEMAPHQTVQIRPVGEADLPSYARKILKEFFRDQGIYFAKVLMVGQVQSGFDFAFSLESVGTPPQQEVPGILEAISWFLPSDYSLMILSEKNFPQFGAL